MLYNPTISRRQGAEAIWLTPYKGDDPRRGVTGVAGGSGSGGVEPNPLSGYGGCNR